MNWYEYALIIWIIISTMWIINLFLIIKIKEKHILEIQDINFKHYHNMWNIHKEMYELTNERLDEVIEYLNNENKE
ncbi:hypothetical protein [Spiroplasma endosymbiont of Colias croceus]|uniref:hypothetical protein n=1 Tax=Spiroplasma endosymbiont of Colias croceus TaxID=3066310 RepID=UPI0030D33C37